MQYTKRYAGIGSRETSEPTLVSMRIIGESLAKKGYTLLSGGAEKADTAFEVGCDRCPGKKEIYLPWKSFNNSNSQIIAPNLTNWEEAQEIASRYHPAWDKLKEAVAKLITRNTYQVLGSDLKSPVDFVLCYTPDGKASGGTGQAIRIAEAFEIPVFNIAYPHRLVNLWKEIEKEKS